MRFRLTLIALWVFLTALLGACGGSGGEQIASACDLESAVPSQALCARKDPLPAAVKSSKRRQPRIPDATAFFDWAERTMPNLYPSAQVDVRSGDVVTRTYPETGNAISISGSGITFSGPSSDPGAPPATLESYACKVFPRSCENGSPDPDRCLNLAARREAALHGDALVPTNGIFTVEMWVMRGEGERQTFFSQGAFVRNGPFRIWSADGVSIMVGGLQSVPLPAGRWVHLAVTSDAAGNTVLYVDGIARSSNTGIYPDFSGGVTVGGFNGCLDELKVWRTVRTPTEVKRDMQKKSASSADLIAYYDFDEKVEVSRVWQADMRVGHILEAGYTVDQIASDEAPAVGMSEFLCEDH